MVVVAVEARRSKVGSVVARTVMKSGYYDGDYAQRQKSEKRQSSGLLKGSLLPETRQSYPFSLFIPW
jgi:hypothetical protein